MQSMKKNHNQQMQNTNSRLNANKIVTKLWQLKYCNTAGKRSVCEASWCLNYSVVCFKEEKTTIA